MFNLPIVYNGKRWAELTEEEKQMYRAERDAEEQKKLAEERESYKLKAKANSELQLAIADIASKIAEDLKQYEGKQFTARITNALAKKYPTYHIYKLQEWGSSYIVVNLPHDVWRDFSWNELNVRINVFLDTKGAIKMEDTQTALANNIKCWRDNSAKYLQTIDDLEDCIAESKRIKKEIDDYCARFSWFSRDFFRCEKLRNY